MQAVEEKVNSGWWWIHTATMEKLASKYLKFVEFEFYEFGTNSVNLRSLLKRSTKFSFGTEYHVLGTFHPDSLTSLTFVLHSCLGFSFTDRVEAKVKTNKPSHPRACYPPMRISSNHTFWSSSYVNGEGSARSRNSKRHLKHSTNPYTLQLPTTEKVTSHKHRYLNDKNKECREE